MMPIRSELRFLVAAAVLIACSSSSSTDSPDLPQDAGRESDAIGGSADSSDANALTDAAGSLREGGIDSGDVASSSACAAYCAKVSQCGKCDPSFDCAPPDGSCPRAQIAYLQCEADTGQFICGSSGWAVISNCHRDNSVCPTSQPPLDAATCMTTPPDSACVSCLQTNCMTQYQALMTHPEFQDFSDCVSGCEVACLPAASCPAECSGFVGAFTAYTNLLYCGNLACHRDRGDAGPNVCAPTTVIF
jgi:hypothetical protein